MSEHTIDDTPGSPALRSSQKKKETKAVTVDFSGPQQFVTIIVIDDNQAKLENTVHRSLICRYSEFFDVAFKSEFKEGKAHEATMDNVEHGIFRLLINWLYYQVVKHPNGRAVTLLEYAKLWSLADMCLMPELQNAAMTELYHDVGFRYITHGHETSDELARSIADTLNYVYSNGTQDKPLGWVCVEVLLPEWNLGSRSSDTINKVYDLCIDSELALGIIKFLSRVGVNFASYEKPPLNRFLVSVSDEKKNVQDKTYPPRRRVFSESAAP